MHTPVHIEGRKYFGVSEDEYWNCVFTVSTGEKVTTAIMYCLESAAASTTGLLAITRYVQLKNPFSIVKKKMIIICIALVFMIIASLQLFHLFSPLHKTVHSNMLMLAMNVNPYNIEFVWSSQYFSEMITNSGTMIVQVAALVLLRKQSNKTLGSKILKRRRGSRVVSRSC